MRDFDPGTDRGLIERAAAQLGCEGIAPGVVDQLASYLTQVVTWNRKLDLTAARGPEAQVDVMLGDAFALAERGQIAEASRLVDVGTGAGAPIVPLLLLREDLSAVCVEPLHKRVAFLRITGARLGLVKRMRVLETRVEPGADAAARLEGGPFDLACSRATLAPPLWLEVGLTLAPQVLVMLAGGGDAPEAPEGVRRAEPVRYRLPFAGSDRAILRYERA